MHQNDQRFALFDPKEKKKGSEKSHLEKLHCSLLPSFFKGAKPRKQGMKSSMIWLVGICLVMQQNLHGLVVVQVSANGPQKRSRKSRNFCW